MREGAAASPARRLVRAALLALLLPAGCRSPRGGAVMDAPLPGAPISKEILPNRATLLWREIPGCPVVALRLYVRAGSLTEQEYLGYGISHVFEHLLSGGTTATRPERESRRILEALGSRSNAYTTTDHTCYHLTARASDFREALSLLSDWVAHSALDPQEVGRELQVVEEEIRKDDNEPDWILYIASNENLFRVHPQRLPVIGYLPLMKRITRDDLKRYYERMYVPENMVFAGAGGLSAEEAMGALREAFAGLPLRAAPALALPGESPQVSRRFLEREAAVKRSLATISWRTIPLSHPDLYPLDILADVLGTGEASRLVRLLRDEKGWVTGVSASSITPAYDAGRFVISFDLDAKDLPEIEASVVAEIARIAREGPAASELDRAKRQRRTQHAFSRQTADAVASAMGLSFLDTGDPAFDDRYVERIQAVSAEEVRRVAREYFLPERTCVTLVRPKARREEMRATARPGPSPVERIALRNGSVLLFGRTPGEPLVSVQGYLLGGLLLEDERTSGLGALGCAVLDRGTRRRGAAEIAALEDSLGGAIGASPGSSTVRLSALLVQEDFERGMDLLGEIAAEPAFPPDEVERKRREQIESIRQREDDWSGELRHRFLRRIHPVHPYGLDIAGAEGSVKGLSRDDLVVWHRRVFTGQNLAVAVFGDLERERVRKAAEAAFGRLPAEPFRLPDRPRDPPLGREVRYEEPTDKGVASVVIGFPGVPLGNVEDRAALDMLDAVLSGVYLPAGRLHQALRGEGAGLVYLVHAMHRAGLDPDRFEVYAACGKDKMGEVRKIIDQHLERARKEPFSEEEIARGKTMWAVHRSIERQTLADRASEAALYERLGLGFDFPARYDDAVQKVTADQMLRAAQKYLSTGAWLTLMPRGDSPNKPPN